MRVGQARYRGAGYGGIVFDDLDLASGRVKHVAFQFQGDIQPVAGFPAHGAAHGQIVPFRFIRAVEGVDQVAIVVIFTNREAAGYGVAETAGHDQFEHPGIVFEIVAVTETAFVILGRRGGGHRKGAGNRVLAKQDALRATQGGDTRQVKHRRPNQLLAAIIDAIDVLANRLLETLVITGADATDVHLRADAALGHLQVGHIVLQIFDPVDPGLPDFLTRGYDDRDRHIGQSLLSFLGGNDDLFEHSPRCCRIARLIIAVRILRLCACGKAEAKHGRDKNKFPEHEP